MKYLKFTLGLIFFVLGMLFSSCMEDTVLENQTEETLIINQDSFELESASGVMELPISARGRWGCVTDAGWIRIPSPEGSGNSIRIEYDQNTSFDSRSATITVVCGTVVKTISITQKQTDVMNSEIEGTKVGCDGGSLQLDVESNVTYDCYVDSDAKDWLSIENTRSLSTRSFYVHVAQNKSTTSRTGKVYVRSNTMGTHEYTIVQEGRKPISLTETSVSLNINSSYTLTLLNGNSDVYWYSDNDYIARVDQSGRVTAVSSGNTWVYAKLYDMIVGCHITVYEPTLSSSSIQMSIGETRTLSVNNFVGTVTWSSSNTLVAEVSNSGVITARSGGSATIRAYVGGLTLTCSVTVKHPSLSTSSVGLYSGDTYSLSVSNYSGAVSWTTTNSSVATVSQSGLVTAVSSGSATIKAYVGNTILSCSVTVFPPSLSSTSIEMSVGSTYALSLRGYTGTTKWQSYNTNIATVSSTGVVTAKGVGTTYVSVTAGNTVYYCYVTVRSSNANVSVYLNSQWKASSLALGSNYDVYESYSNIHLGNSYATMRVDFTGLPNFYFYILSYAESGCDYVWVSQIDASMPISSSVPIDYLSRATTAQNPYNGINNFSKVNVQNDGGSHHVWVTYRKDNNGKYSNEDRGYLAIPKNF